MMKNVGLNLRLLHSLFDLLKDAQRLQLDSFQCFLTYQHNGTYIKLSSQERMQFVQDKNLLNLYIHGSYKINLADLMHWDDSCYFLKKELTLARQLQAQALIAHPGAVTQKEDRMNGIDAIAKKINRVFKKTDFPLLLLENVAFGKRAIGGSIEDLALIRAKLDKPEKVQFCIDTAHAYSYGYNLADLQEQNRFITLLDEIVGINSIALIHLNDTKQPLGIQHDQHEIPGMGNIGLYALKQFVCDNRLRHIPIIIELPVVSKEVEKEIIDTIRLWRLL